MQAPNCMTSLYVSIAALALCLMAEPAQAGDTLRKIRQTHTITIAHREESLPFSYLDANKKPVGYAIDVCLRIADAVKRELKLPQLNIAYLPVTPSTRIAALTEGKADLECGSTTNNAERRKYVAFTIPHFVASTRMIVRTDSGIKNWADLRNKRVVTTKGSTTVKLLHDRDHVLSLDLKLVEGRDHGESFDMVAQGKVDAFSMDEVLLYGLRANAPKPESFSIVGDPLSAEAYAIMLRKDDPAFKTLVDHEMSRLINDGEIYKLYDKWFKSPLPPKGINMNMQMGHLLRDFFRFPTDKVGDE